MTKKFALGVISRLVGVTIVTLLATGAIFAQDGKLLTTSVIRFSDSTLDEGKQPHALRTILDEVEIRSITYLSDGLKVQGYLALPKEAEKWPCLIYNRGGNRSFGALEDKDAAILLGRMASWGYVVAASQYRENAGGEGQEEFGGSDVADVLNLIPLLESVPQADASRIGMYGWSCGGMMTYIAAQGHQWSRPTRTETSRQGIGP